MYINGLGYTISTTLKLYQSIRDYMVYNIYSRMEYVNEIMNIIGSKIDCLDISFDSMRYEINISIKKTTMRRAKGYKASSMYYYGVINSVFKEFLNNHPEIFVQIKECVNGCDNINTADDCNYDNICQVYCIGDKAVNIKL